MDVIKYGDPFVMAVTEGNLNDQMDSADLGGFEPVCYQNVLVQGMRDDCEQHGGAEQLYICIPIGRVWAADYNPDDGSNGPYNDVRVEIAESELERMARAAIAMGVSDGKKPGRANT